jgi:hypothetical protein
LWIYNVVCERPSEVTKTSTRVGIVILGGVAATLAVAIAMEGILAWVVGTGALYAVVQVVRTTVSEYQACWS